MPIPVSLSSASSASTTQGLAGTGALAAKLTREYFEYSRGDWLRQTLVRLLEYELQLRSERALLGATDSDTKDALAAKEVASTLDDGAKALTARFVISRLCPSHQDLPEEQLASFPALHGLSPEDRTALSQKFVRTDTASFRSWLRRIVRF